MQSQVDANPLGLDLAPPAAALAPSTVLGQGRAFFMKDLREQRSQHDRASEEEALTCQLALKHRLMLSEVKHIMRAFNGVPKNAEGGLDRKDFEKGMCKIFEVDAIDEPVAKSAYKATSFQHKVDIGNFLDWYVQNMFTQVNSLNCAKDKVESEKLIYELAKKHKVSTVVIDKVKSKFDHFDTDKSGIIDYKEFCDMFCSILKVKTVESLNPERMKRFWQEIDADGSDGVCFWEFAEWYLKYFNVDTDDPDDFAMAGPLRAFYDSYDPQVQRRGALQSIASIN